MNEKFTRKPVTVLQSLCAGPDVAIGVQNQSGSPGTRAKPRPGADLVFASEALSVFELQLMCEVHLNLLDTGRLY